MSGLTVKGGGHILLIMEFTPEQKKAFSWIVDEGGRFLCADIGTGKTLIASSSMAEIGGRTLVLGPKQVVMNTWPDEYNKWPHLRSLKVGQAVGQNIEARANIVRAVDRYDVVLLNFDLIPWLCNRMNTKTPYFENLIVDEIDKLSHQMVRRLSKFQPFKNVLGMTATPVTESLTHLWAQFRLVVPDLFPTSRTVFINKYFYSLDPNGYTVVPKDENQLVKMVAPHIHRIEKVFPYRIVYRGAQTDPRIIEAINRLSKTRILKIGDSVIEAESAAVLTQKVKQLSAGFIYNENRVPIWLSDFKITALTGLLTELERHQVLICYSFQAEKERLKDICPVFDDKSPKLLDRWNQGKVRTMAIHPASAGHGLNLQHGGCKHIIFLSLPWSGRLFKQAIGRIARRGQKNEVSVHVFTGHGTIDERVLSMLLRKKATEEAILKFIQELGDSVTGQ